MTVGLETGLDGMNYRLNVNMPRECQRVFKEIIPKTKDLKYLGAPGVDGSMADASVVTSAGRLRVLVDPPLELLHKVTVVTGKLKHGHTRSDIEAEVRSMRTVTYLHRTPCPVTGNCIPS